MLKKSKWIFYFRHLFLMSTINKVRLSLTSIGIFVAVFLFSAGLIITNSFYNGKFKIIDEMEDNTVVIKSYQDSAAVKSDISKFTSVPPIDDMLLFEKKPIFSTLIGENQYLTVMTNVHGVSSIHSLAPIVTDSGDLLPVSTTLVKGRLISQSDVQSKANVVVIDEFTASLLSPNGDVLGKKFELGGGANGAAVASTDGVQKRVELEVIGVVKNSYQSETKKLMLKEEINKQEGNVEVYVSVYTPITALDENYPDDDKDRFYIYEFEKKDQYESFESKIMSYTRAGDTRGESHTMSTKDMLYEGIEKDISQTKSLMNIILLILCVISGISIMSIIFFSVKERIPEIGIRKAFGASKLDIAFQFVFEMVIVATVVSIFAVCLSFFACKLTETYLTNQLFIPFSVSVSLQQLLLPVLIGVIEAIICSIIPSLYAAKIKVTDSLKFE